MNIELHNIKRIADGVLMLGEDVSLPHAIEWCSHYNSLKGLPYPNGEGYYYHDFVVVRLDLDLVEYLTVQ